MEKKLFALIIISALLLNACQSNNSNTTPTADANVIYTMAAQTVDAMGTMVAATLQTTVTPAATITPVPPLILPTVPATPPTQISAATPPPAASTAAAGTCDKATFVSDVTYPDGTNVPAGTGFTKTWRLMNAGSCTWGAGYKLIFVSGDAMGAASPIALSSVLAPGATVDVSAPMTAPTINGSYTGNWMLQNANGSHFGVGGVGNGAFYVNISVGNGTPGTGGATATLSYFAVNNVILSSTSPSAYNGACPVNITTQGSMIVSQGGTITYHYELSDDSALGGAHNLVFSAAGTQSFSDILPVSASGTYNVFVDSPNHQHFRAAAFTVTCK